MYLWLSPAVSAQKNTHKHLNMPQNLLGKLQWNRHKQSLPTAGGPRSLLLLPQVCLSSSLRPGAPRDGRSRRGQQHKHQSLMLQFQERNASHMWFQFISSWCFLRGTGGYRAEVQSVSALQTHQHDVTSLSRLSLLCKKTWTLDFKTVLNV